MQYVHYEGIFKSSIDLLSPGWFGVTLLSLSEAALCGLLKKAKWSIYTASCAESEAAQGREDRAKHSPLPGSTQSAARANILSIHDVVSPPSLAAAVCVLVCSHHVCCPLRFDFPRVFSGPLRLSSNTKHQGNAQQLS